MKALVGGLLLLALAAGGCTSKSAARAQARAAFLAGQHQATMRMQSQGAAVTVLGPVRNPVIQWTENLTLAEAIIAAEYQAVGDPGEILIFREGRTTRVNPADLLRGEDVPLLPGDRVEIRP